MKALCLFFAAFLLEMGASYAQGKLALYEKSLATFEAGKKEHGNSYTFVLKTASFTGAYTETTITVLGGQVVERRFKRANEAQKNWEHATEWTERGAEIGKHKEEGAPVQTMDELYKAAKSYAEEADRKAEEDKKPITEENPPILGGSSYFFSVGKEGIIEMAGALINGCLDDCFRGYKVSAFAWGALPDVPKTKQKAKSKSKAKSKASK